MKFARSSLLARCCPKDHQKQVYERRLRRLQKWLDGTEIPHSA